MARMKMRPRPPQGCKPVPRMIRIRFIQACKKVAPNDLEDCFKEEDHVEAVTCVEALVSNTKTRKKIKAKAKEEVGANHNNDYKRSMMSTVEQDDEDGCDKEVPLEKKEKNKKKKKKKKKKKTSKSCG